MALVNMKKMLEKAKVEKYAVGQFNINNLEWTKTILTVAEEMNSPVILGVSEGAARYMGGFNTVVGMVKGLLKDLGITVDVAIHLDHGSSFESCKKAIDAGFTSVMIDASHHPLEENIKMTKEVVDYAHARKVTVEAELGTVGGQEDDVIGKGIRYADVNECVRLVKEAEIDALAPALGSVHGPYKGEPKLGFKEMLEIKEATNTTGTGVCSIC
jgi:fructose-bisphosphate aldolase class II